MVAFYFPKNWRHHKLLLILMAIELPLTIAVLTFTGIASHDLYRTKLQQDGADNGFNSAPDEALYAAANYRPFHPPIVWSHFLTHYTLVLGVVSTFILITKTPIHLLRIFYPPFALFINGGLTVLYVLSVRFQAGSDMSDPRHPQKGPPWYITKSCDVAAHKSNIGYCKQAKSLFGFTIVLLTVYAIEVVLSIWSCFLTKQEKEERRERREEKQAIKEYEETILRSPSVLMSPRPDTIGTIGLSSMTPRTPAFNRIDGGSPGLPLRDYNQRLAEELSAPRSPPQTYFPPPPKKESKR